MEFGSFNMPSMPEVPKKKDEPEGEKVNEGRRSFLKFAAIVGAAALTGIGIEGCGTKKEEKKKPTAPKPEENKKIVVEESPDLCLDKNDENNEEVDIDAKTVRDVIRYNSKDKIDIDIAKKTQLLWEYRYSKVPDYKNSLKKGLERMGETQIKEVLAIFEDERKAAMERGCLLKFDKMGKMQLDKAFKVPKDLKIPEELIFLSIAESHFDKDAVSKAGAVGLFQLMKGTAIDFGLKVDNKIDERFDPEKNTRGAIRCLIDLYVRTMTPEERNGSIIGKTKGDWNLALAGYNGSYIWRYLGSCGIKRKKPSYEEFLLHISKELNDKRDYYRNKKTKYAEYKVKKGDTLSTISETYKVDSRLIEKTNKLNKKIVKEGQKIRVPLFTEKPAKTSKPSKTSKHFKTPKIVEVSNEEARKAFFGKFVSGYAENLTYPPKYLAILKIIKQQKPELFKKNNN